MIFSKNLFLLCLVALLTGCAGTYRTYAEMFELAFTPATGAALPFSELTAPNPDYLYVRLGDQPRAVMGLLFIEQAQFKWTSANNIVLVTEQGRIVRSLGLPNDLLHTSNRTADPIKAKRFDNSEWTRQLDWSAGEFGYTVTSTFTEQANETLTFFGQQINAKKVIETLRYDNPTAYLRFDGAWQNIFWYDETSGKLLQSQQQLAPGTPAYEIIFISEIARQLQQSGVQIAGDAI
ncbi:YjbF family lipoprotein [Alishewanella tabrizica]|nr:YjbF family lipoprotein [Alishewanella tabrizica]